MILGFAARKTFNDFNNFIRGGWVEAKRLSNFIF